MLRCARRLAIVAAIWGCSQQWPVAHNSEVRQFESVKRMQLRCSTLVALTSLIWLTGCGTVNHMQFRVTAGPSRSAAPGSRATVAPSDRTQVEEILKEAAQRLHL